jgi:hypothetical protein
LYWAHDGHMVLIFVLSLYYVVGLVKRDDETSHPCHNPKRPPPSDLQSLRQYG